MKLDRLRMLRTELEREFSPDGITSDIYYFFSSNWHALDESKSLPTGTLASLAKAETEPVAHHAASERLAWFSCPNAGCSISLRFNSSPRLETRKAARTRIDQVVQHANNAYKVAHNPLTLLLARDEFRDRLRKAMESNGPGESEDAETDGLSPRTLAILALDIDHFKQINDTHGHLYGDQVLKTFARRLESTASQMKAALGDTCVVELGHPSGEEFLVLIHGPLDRDQILEWANIFRKSICETALPGDIEWGWLTERENLSSIVAPPLHERHVSASIGVAFHTKPNSNEPASESIPRILEHADTALYRAKAAGRNQVIPFDSIMSECGRVLEQDPATRVVAIDIGKNVGVTIGQDFRVLSATFTGKKKFVVSDGRTVRTLGTYPKVELTRVTVFDVQPELSFAFISNASDMTINIEQGYHLEAIPIGSIGHALPHAARYLVSSTDGVKVGDISSLQTLVNEISTSKSQPFAAVFRFSRSTEYLRRYGSAALNASLTRLFRTVSAAFSVPCTTGVLDASSVCVVGRKAGYNEASVNLLTERIAEEHSELGLVVGLYIHEEQKKTEKSTGPQLSPEHAIEFARFAASDHAITPGKTIAKFSATLASSILSRQRDIGLFQTALADYEKLSSLGIDSASISNQAALIYSRMGEKVRAAEMFLAASKKGPEVLVFKSNYATAAEALGEDGIAKALELLNPLTDKQVDELKTSHPYGYVSYARLLARAKISGSELYLPARFSKIGPIALGIDGYTESRFSNVIKEALQGT